MAEPTSSRRSTTKSGAASRRRTPPATPALSARTAAAAEEAVRQNVTDVRVPGVGHLSLPPLDHLAWYAGVTVLAAAEIIEWPVALVLAAGHVLADNRAHRTLRSLGDALEEGAG